MCVQHIYIITFIHIIIVISLYENANARVFIITLKPAYSLSFLPASQLFMQVFILLLLNISYFIIIIILLSVCSYKYWYYIIWWPFRYSHFFSSSTIIIHENEKKNWNFISLLIILVEHKRACIIALRRKMLSYWYSYTIFFIDIRF